MYANPNPEALVKVFVRTVRTFIKVLGKVVGKVLITGV